MGLLYVVIYAAFVAWCQSNAGSEWLTYLAKQDDQLPGGLQKALPAISSSRPPGVGNSQCFVAGPLVSFAIFMIVWHTYGAITSLLDRFTPPFLERYKLHRLDTLGYWDMLPKVLSNQCLVFFPSFIVVRGEHDLIHIECTSVMPEHCLLISLLRAVFLVTAMGFRPWIPL